MDLFAHLNYCYPGTANAARLHHHVSSHQPQGLGSSHHVPVQNIQSPQDQTHPGEGYTRSDPSRITQACPSLDFAAGHGLRPQQKSTPVGPQPGAVHSDPTCPTEIYYMDESTDLSDQYIPSSSDKITCTDHRPLDEIFGDIRSSLGWSQAKSGLIHPLQSGTPRGHPQHTSVLTYPLPTKPQLDGVVQIPLLAVDNQMSGTGLVVTFQCSDWGIGVEVEGIPMSDLLHGNVSGLENPHQRVLDGLGLTDLRLNILWPHYPPFAKVISAFGTGGEPITRAELGYEVSLAFAEFFYITSRSIPPAQRGPYAISSSPPGSSSPEIKFDQLHLITVRNTSRGEWVAEIRAVSMP
ncbi:hypothetical protein J3R83DRAFT_12548 [Lanmaoa asiatica]|nr:hypothetical protein J3R83DRAFT_12548 [Lanmaoa asiatica]